MYFKNLQPYRLSTEWPITAEVLHEQLARKPFHSCGSQDFESRGWVSPADDGALVRTVGDNWMVCLQSDEKILPAAVVKQIADERADEIAEQQGLLDGDYQGEIFLALWNAGAEPFDFTALERLAQIVIVPIVRPTFQIVSAFTRTTERGEGGFGSTGSN